MLIGLKELRKKEEILSHARNLAGSRFDSISIGHDLTRAQRDAEKRLQEKAQLLNVDNAALPLGERRQVEYKVVGRMGERMVRPIPADANGVALPRASARLAPFTADAGRCQSSQTSNFLHNRNLPAPAPAQAPNTAQMLGQLARTYNNPATSTPNLNSRGLAAADRAGEAVTGVGELEMTDGGRSGRARANSKRDRSHSFSQPRDTRRRMDQTNTTMEELASNLMGQLNGSGQNGQNNNM